MNLRGYRFTELFFKASYDNGDESEASTVKGDQDGYYETTMKLVPWSIRGYRNVTMTIVARVKKMPLAAAALACSTLRRAEARVSDLCAKLGTGGHPAARIRRQWTCKWPDCPRYRRTCWWESRTYPSTTFQSGGSHTVLVPRNLRRQTHSSGSWGSFDTADDAPSGSSKKYRRAGFCRPRPQYEFLRHAFYLQANHSSQRPQSAPFIPPSRVQSRPRVVRF